MRNRITFQTTEDGTKIEGYTADTNFTGNILEKIDKHAKEFTIPTWASELTFCMFLMDALEDAVPEARVIPLNIEASWSIHLPHYRSITEEKSYPILKPSSIASAADGESSRRGLPLRGL